MRFVSGMLLTVVLAVTLVAAGPAASPPGHQAAAPAPGAVANVIVVTLDGLRWQEFFGGAERALFGKDADKDDPPTAVKRFWRDTPTVAIIADSGSSFMRTFFWMPSKLSNSSTPANAGSAVLVKPGTGTLCRKAEGMSFAPRLSSTSQTPFRESVCRWAMRPAGVRSSSARIVRFIT